MRAVVVYESLFGNTHQIAESVASGIRSAWPNATVECVPVTAAAVLAALLTCWWSALPRTCSD